MARRRKPVHPVSGAPKPPKPAKVKLPKPDMKALVAIYKKLIAGSVTARVQALYEAITWWDSNIKVFLAKKPMDSSNISTYEKANKARTLGIGSGSGDEEKETALRHTIKLYEKIWAADNKIPAISPYLTKLDEQKAKLEAQEKALQAKHAEVLSTLQTAFSPLGVNFAVQKSEIARQFDGLKTILVSQDLCKGLADKAKAEGILSMIFSEVTTVLKAASIERDEDGDSVYNVQRLVSSIPAVLTSILQFCETVPKGKVFKAAPDTLEATATASQKSPKVRVPRTPKDPNAPKPQRTASLAAAGKVGGRYKAGSSIATIYERLADQQVHTVSELAAGLALGNPMDRLKWIKVHGDENGRWKLDITGEKVKMTLI